MSTLVTQPNACWGPGGSNKGVILTQEGVVVVSRCFCGSAKIKGDLG